jgi:hypothetical protein
MSKAVKQMTREEYELESRQCRMANILATPFMNFNRIGLNSGLRQSAEGHSSFIRPLSGTPEITMQELAEFYLQVGDCIFSPKNEKVDDEQGSR